MAVLRGSWTLRATLREAGWRQGVRISGSSGMDGIHEMDVGTVIGPVDGQSVEVMPFALNEGTGEWEPSNERGLMSWDEAKGVILTIYADDNPAGADMDFNDLVVECTSNDGELNAPRTRPLDLTIPEQAIGHRSPDAPWNR